MSQNLNSLKTMTTSYTADESTSLVTYLDDLLTIVKSIHILRSCSRELSLFSKSCDNNNNNNSNCIRGRA